MQVPTLPAVASWQLGAAPTAFESVSLRQVLGSPSLAEFDGIARIDPAHLLHSDSYLRVGGGVLQRGAVARVEARGERVSCTVHGPLARLAGAVRLRCLPPMTVRQLVVRLGQDHAVAVDAGDLPEGAPTVVWQEYETDLQLLRRLAVQHGFLFWESTGGLVCRSRLDSAAAIRLARQSLLDAPRITHQARSVGAEARAWLRNDGSTPTVQGAPAGAANGRPERMAFRLPHVDDVDSARRCLDRIARAEVGGNCRVQAAVVDPRVAVGVVIVLPSGLGCDEPLLVVEACHEVASEHVTRFVAVPVAMAAPAPAPAHPHHAGVALAQVVEVEDPEGRGRVRIRRCDTLGEGEGVWAPVVQAAAGAQHGSFVLPRIGDQVVVTFLAGDPNRPLVTGSLYHGAHQPPTAEEQSGRSLRLLRTPGGTEVRCEQSDAGDTVVVSLPSLTLRIRGGDEPQLDIAGQADVSITGRRLSFEAKDELAIRASSIRVQARGQVEIDGSQILLG